MDDRIPAAQPNPDERRITALFDALLLEGATPEILVERAAVAVRATVGRVSRSGATIARDGSGATAPPHPSSAAITRPLADGWVWVDGVAARLGAHLLDRLAAALAIVERWGAVLVDSARDPLDVLVDDSASAIARDDALARLGLSADTDIRVVICSGPEGGVHRLIEALTAGRTLLARTTREGRTTLLLLHDGAPTIELDGVPLGVRVAYGRVRPLARVHDSYRNAHDAYLFTRPSPHDLGPYQPVYGVLIDGARLTGLTALCRLRREDIELVDEVRVLDALERDHGDQIIHLLEAYAITGSMRRAATQVYLHHNSVAYWVQKAESELGYSLTEANRRAQFFVTVCLYRIWKEYTAREDPRAP